MDKMTKIGKVNIDLTDYSGEDLYSEGFIEDELLEAARNNERKDFRKLIEKNPKWPYLYHFSPIRENIVTWLPIKESDSILEVGGGMGAVTNALCRMGKEVDCIDLSYKRLNVNAERNKDMDNLNIRVGNFTDIEPKLPKYDWIMLIGVFEYAISYMNSDNPFEDFLRILLKHLKEGGRLVIAIENRTGLKYFAGCKEDHTSDFYSGIEGYAKGGQVRTFSRNGLERIFKAVGIEEYKFFYPYPDYKLPNAIFSDSRLPGIGELKDNIRNFDQDRLLLFDENKAFDAIVEENLFPVFSNSYEVVIGPDPKVDYCKYSFDRSDKYCVYTVIKEDENRVKKVYKRAGNETSKQHIANMKKAFDVLRERYQCSDLKFNEIISYDGDKGEIVFEFLEGKTLEEILDECVLNGNKEEFIKNFERFRSYAYHNDDCPIFDEDMIFSNIIVNNDLWTVIDYEWVKFTKGNAGELVSRAINNYFMNPGLRDKAKEWIDTVNDYREDLFQKGVIEDSVPMSNLRHEIGKGVYSLSYLTDKVAGLCTEVQIYEDFGGGFSEEYSYYVNNIKKNGPDLEFEVPINKGVKNLRIDPGNRPCRFYVNFISLNGKDVTSELMGMFKNGCIDLRNAVWTKNVITFKSDDPHIKLRVGKMGAREGDRLLISCRIETIF